MPTLVSALRAGLCRVGVGAAVEGYASASHVAMTYDDGPDPVATAHILDELRDQRAHATFFVLLTRVRRYPSVLQEILGEGHELALHGTDHTNLATLPRQVVASRLLDGLAELSDTAQVEVNWFRPPYVSLSLGGWVASRRIPHTFVAAGSSLRDWEPLTDSQRIAAFRESLTAGDVILAHDAWPSVADGAHDGPEPQVDRRDLTKRALEEITARGLVSVNLTTLSQSGACRTTMRVSVRHHA